MTAPKGSRSTRSMGSPVTLMRHLERVHDTASVPCNGCTACCRSKAIRVEISAAEAQYLHAHHVDPDGLRILDRQADGACIYLQAGKCSVYERRPATCKFYDCRRYVLAGVLPTDPVMHAAVEQWRPEFKTDDDRDYFIAARLAATEARVQVCTVSSAIAAAATQWRDYLPRARQSRRKVAAMTQAEKDKFCMGSSQVMVNLRAAYGVESNEPGELP